MIYADFDRPSWKVLGKQWPNSETSRFVEAGHMRWHVQEMGEGPTLLLLHGTGASSHSWRDLMPLLARRFHIVAPDLPGHGFSNAPDVIRLTLPRVAGAIAALLESLDHRPALAAGHSAGAAVALHMAVKKQIDPRGLIGLNGAFLPFKGVAGHVFPSLAKLLYLNPLAPRLFALGGHNRTRVERLIAGTGSTIDEEGLGLYQKLMTAPGHVSGALAMMASWDLDPLKRAMPTLETPMLLISGSNDKAVPPAVAQEVAGLVPDTELVDLPGLGHLAHEERPEEVARPVTAFAERIGVLTAG